MVRLLNSTFRHEVPLLGAAALFYGNEVTRELILASLHEGEHHFKNRGGGSTYRYLSSTKENFTKRIYSYHM